MPSTMNEKNIVDPVPTAPIAAGPSGLTMMVSTMPMVTQPISAITTGIARRIIAINSRRTSVSYKGWCDGELKIADWIIED